eukprot:TRINITY_DN347_c0_g1_i1.p1 TRINITY_DN347_c0_g1~~TRINITY_DN347_c0_g1_i1.p1  ORF type:complete len:219 (-),score=34.91 TRINITY_DN347_c0_g1_i1:176-832(-)
MNSPLVVVTSFSVLAFGTYFLYLKYKSDEEKKRKALEMKRERDERLRIINEQNLAYEMSLLADMEKEEKLRREMSNRENEDSQAASTPSISSIDPSSIEAVIQASIKVAEEEEKKRKLREILETQFLKEPDTDFTLIKILMTSGEAIIRKFPMESTIQNIMDFVSTRSLEECGGWSVPERFILVTDFPRTEFRDFSLTLREAKFESPRASNIKVYDLD